MTDATVFSRRRINFWSSTVNQNNSRWLTVPKDISIKEDSKSPINVDIPKDALSDFLNDPIQFEKLMKLRDLELVR